MITHPSLAIERERPLSNRATDAARLLSHRLAVPPPTRNDDHGPRSRRWWDQSLAKGAAGVAVLHGIRGRDEHPRHDLVRRWLTRAAREDISAAPGCGLWFGAPAMAFALHIAAPGGYPGTAAALHAAVLGLVDARLDAATRRLAAAKRPSRSEFDLVRGLAGLGAYLLVRDPDGVPLRRILDYLVRLTEPVHAHDEAGRTVPGWWTHDVPNGAGVDEFGDGHADLGMAHGICGPLALLALTMRRGATVPGHSEAIARICCWLDAWRNDAEAGIWWPERITLAEARAGGSIQAGPLRPSWCYGTPGMARAQQLAGVALGDTSRQVTAERALFGCVTDPAQLAQLVDAGICHGWAGVVTTVRCAAREARSPALAAALPRLVDTLIAQTAGLSAETPAGLVDGAAGIALALHGAPTQAVGNWATCLLLR